MALFPSRRHLLLLQQRLKQKPQSIGRHFRRNVYVAKIGKFLVAIKKGSVFFRPIVIKKTLEAFAPIIKRISAKRYSVRVVKIFFATQAKLIRKGRVINNPHGGITMIPEKRASEQEYLVMEKVNGLNFEELSKALSSGKKNDFVKRNYAGATHKELQSAFYELADNFHLAKKQNNIKNLELSTNNIIVESFDKRTRKFSFVLVDLYSPFVD